MLGLVLTAPAVVFFAVGVDGPGYCLTAVAFGAAAFNACTGLCLGCKLVALIRHS